MRCIISLTNKPIAPNIWSALLSLDPIEHGGWFLLHQLNKVRVVRSCSIKPKIYPCVPQHEFISDIDVANFKQMLRKWTSSFMSRSVSTHELKELYNKVPGSRRYIKMAQVEHLCGNVVQDLFDTLAKYLRPQSENDARENSLWIQNLLWHIHAKVCSY